MLLAIIDFLQYATVIALFLFAIVSMVKQDFKDERRGEKPIASLESENSESVTDVVYYESMAPNERFKKIVDELDKIDKLSAPCEQRLNGARERLRRVRNLQRDVTRAYRTERARFDGAIAWLEKPLATRGKYRPVPGGENDIPRDSLDDAKKRVRSMTTAVPENVAEDANSADEVGAVLRDVVGGSDGKNAETVSENPKSPETIVPRIPEVKLESVLAAGNAVLRRFWPLGKFWSRELLNNLSESAKLWFVVFMLVRRSVLNSANAEKAMSAVSEPLRRLIDVQTRVDGKCDRTTITLVVFPKGAEERRNVVARFVAKAKSVFDY